jgi:hypothetical protein
MNRPVAALLTLLSIVLLAACTARVTPTPVAVAPPSPTTTVTVQPATPTAIPPTWTATIPPTAEPTATPSPSPSPSPTTPPPSPTSPPTATPTTAPTAQPPTATLAPTTPPTTAPTAAPSPVPPPPPAPPPPPGDTNLLPNPSFEEGWYNLYGIPELQVANRWTLEWDEGTNPLDPDPWNAFVRPETRVLSREFIPPHEHDLYIWDGNHTVKIFKGTGAISVRLWASTQLEPGRYRFEIQVFPDLVVGYTPDGQKIWAPDPLSGEVRLYTSAGGTVWMLPTFGTRNTFAYEFTLGQGGITQLGVALRGRWAITNNGWFVDNWSLVRLLD